MINIFKSGSGDFMANYIINLFGNICELFIILFFLKDNYKPRFKKTIFIPLCILFTLFQFLNTNLFLAESNFVILGSLLFVFLVLLIHRLNWKNHLAFLFFLFAIIGCSEVIVGMLFSLIFRIDISFIQNNAFAFATGTVASKFLAYFFVLLTKRNRISSNYKKGKQLSLLIYSLPIASLLVILLFLRCCYQISDTVFEIITLTASIVLTVANITVFYIVDKQNELIETKEKLLFAEIHINNQVMHYQELNKHQNELKIFRHDIKNRLLSLMALVKDGKSDKALQIMENNLNWLEEMNSNIINSGNPIVDAILQAKLHIAKDKNISLQISTKLAEEITIDELELGIVLGNALDNAIEAVEKNVDKDKKYISLTLMSTDDRISISVSNPVEEDIDTERLITSKDDKEKHGYGIKSIKAIVQKYDGIVSFSCENRVFNVSINMANK